VDMCNNILPETIDLLPQQTTVMVQNSTGNNILLFLHIHCISWFIWFMILLQQNSKGIKVTTIKLSWYQIQHILRSV